MTSRRVVIADNNEFYRRVLGDFYREIGWDVSVAAEGIEALELIRKTPPSLVILDLIMPCLDGAALCAHLKNSPATRRIPVVILSGILADEIDNRDAIRADAYIAKMPLPQLQEALREATEVLVSGSKDEPLLRGFEKMFRREVVLELLADRKLQRDILDSLSEGIVELSRDRRLLATNRALQELTGLPPESLLSRQLTDLFGESRPVLEEMFAEVDRGARLSCRRITHAGRSLEMKLHSFGRQGAAAQAVVSAARDTEKVQLEAMLESVGYTMLVEDVTERLKAETDRIRLAERLASSEKLASVGLLASGAAHEINNPLTAVLGHAQLLAAKAPAELKGQVDAIAAAAGRCRAIVENLSAFARGVRPQRAPVDLNDLVRDALAECRDRLQAAGVDLHLELAGDLPSLQADGSQVRRAILAILDNAARALTASPGSRYLRVCTSWSTERVTASFEDSGPGIPPAVLGRIFDPFFTTRDVGDGIGLGLSMAYGVVTGHGGKIRAANRNAGGASIMLEFPRKGPQALAAGAAARAASEPAPRPRGRRVLIADEVVVVQELLVDMLEEGEHHIDITVTGTEAMGRIVSDDYDLLIMDMRLPDMTGPQIYDQMAELRPEMLRRLVFMTAGPVPPETESFLRRTGAPCLVKPFEVERALRVVDTILRTD